jgi:glycosyltransferase involved in cell wall biosynthesis
VLGYVGIINNQDGVDHIVRAVHHLTRELGVTDVHTAVVGDGPALASVRALAHELGVENDITFTGYLSGPALLAALSAFDIGIIPDPMNEYNDKISMNKVFEYSALGIPIVSYNLAETQRLLGGAQAVADSDDPAGLARAVKALAEDEGRRLSLATESAALARRDFSWDREAGKLVEAYARLLPAPELARA